MLLMIIIRGKASDVQCNCLTPSEDDRPTFPNPDPPPL